MSNHDTETCRDLRAAMDFQNESMADAQTRGHRLRLAIAEARQSILDEEIEEQSLQALLTLVPTGGAARIGRTVFEAITAANAASRLDTVQTELARLRMRVAELQQEADQADQAYIFAQQDFIRARDEARRLGCLGR